MTCAAIVEVVAVDRGDNDVVEAELKEASLLLAPSESGEGFSRHYFEALQREPDVVLAHREVTKLLGRKKL